MVYIATYTFLLKNNLNSQLLTESLARLATQSTYAPRGDSVQTQQKLIALTSVWPCAFKFNPKTTSFGKVNTSAKVFVYCNKQTI